MICPVCDDTRFDGFAPKALRCHGCGCVARPAVTIDSHPEPEIPDRYVAALRSRGFRNGKLLNPALDSGEWNAAGYAAAALLDRLHRDPAPGEVLSRIHTALTGDAPLLVSVPRAGRWLFDENSLQLLLLRYGFHQIRLHQRTRDMLVATAIRAEIRTRPKCSIIVAAFNESGTFSFLMDALLAKAIAGMDREIIVVESNSTDGTRELALQYQHCPGVKLLLQDQPRGKGHAVREAFRYADGDVVLIQDADLEYDLNDYDALLAPILVNRAAFVLGTRHAGHWKMREFAKQKILSAFVNAGHAFFTGLINVLFRQRMTDPFTMFKVFRRECLYGLEFACDRFDFDHELVIKFVRKGYRPLEIPVNYRSRSFREGKKVRMFRDPLNWLWVDLKLRFTRVLPKDTQ